MRWIAGLLVVSTVAAPLTGTAAAAPPDAAQLRTLAARFEVVELAPDVSHLPESERAALAKLIEAARVLDALFLRQVWAGNETLLVALAGDDSPLGRARLDNFLLNKGPWSRLDADAPFISGMGPKPAGANFYPEDATKAELEAWMSALPADERAAARGFYTTVRRRADRSLVAVPYSLEYQGELARVAALLREASALSKDGTLKAFLEKRAEACLSNDYYASEVAWMELDAAVEPTIGPYEGYEDGLFNTKAAFEAFIGVRDPVETTKLAALGSHLQDVEDHLPIDKALRNPKLGALSPIRVVNLVFAAGDANRGVQTIAFNLPNDERVVAEKGSKRVMLRNVQQAKFDRILVPLARLALPAPDVDRVSFDAFFTWVLMHELMHGLGPHNITVAGRATTVRAEMKDLYSALEEAKADISGLWALQYLVDQKVLDPSLERTMYATFLASAFRSLRWGLGESHARGVAVQLNRLLDRKAVVASKDGTFAVDIKRIKPEVADLTRVLMTLEAHGDRAGTEAIFKELAVIRPEVQRVLDRAGDVPHDIRLKFVTAERLTAP
jgi:Peptidase family M49